MGLRDGLTATLIRSGKDGRSYYAPFGRFGPVYEVPSDQDAHRLRRRYQSFTPGFYFVLIGFLVVIAAGPAAVVTRWPWLMLLINAAGVSFALLVARGLPRARIRYTDLVPVTWAEAFEAYILATGRKNLEFVVAASLVLSALVLLMTLWIGGVVMWLIATLLVFFTGSQFHAVRRARR